MTLAISSVVTIMIGLLLLTTPSEAAPPRVGLLLAGSQSDASQAELDQLREGLRELGHVEGRTITFEPRWADQNFDRFPALAAELVRLKVDVILASVAASVNAARHATTTIPIVLVVNDPVAAGFVSNLARPGGNITGLSQMSADVVGKQMGLLKDVVPRLSRVAVVSNPTNPGHARQLREADAAARRLRIQLQRLQAQTPDDIARAVTAMRKERADAFVVLLDPILYRRREQITELAAKHRLPGMYSLTREVESGGLIAYGTNLRNLYRRAAIYVDKILKGAKPGDLPIEQPVKFELAVNLKTAEALGLTTPPSVLVRADHVIGR